MRKPTTVLIANHDDSFREALGFLLADLPGVQLVGQARSGRETLELAAVHRPDVVLIDVYLPHLDGLAATRVLKALPNAPVVLMCTHDIRADLSAARAAGVDALLPKRDICDRLVAVLGPRAPRAAAGFGTAVPAPRPEAEAGQPARESN